MKNIDNFQHKKNGLNNERSSLEAVGSFLKQAREEKNLSTEKLAKELNLGEEQLIAIENGQEEFLPEKVFINGMVRRISEKLGIQIPENVFNPIDQPTTSPKIDANESSQNESDNDKPTFLKKNIYSLALIILILGILLPNIFIKYFYNLNTFNGDSTPEKTQKRLKKQTN